MPGEVLSSIELILPPNVVEACYKLKRDLRARFQAVNKEKGTCSEITVHKQEDDSVKLFIAVINLENADAEIVDETSVETSRSEVPNHGSHGLALRGHGIRLHGSNHRKNSISDGSPPADKKEEKEEKMESDNDRQQIAIEGNRGRGRSRGRRGWWKRQLPGRNVVNIQQDEEKGLPDEHTVAKDNVKDVTDDSVKRVKEYIKIKTLPTSANMDEEKEPQICKEDVAPPKGPWPTKATLKQPPEVILENQNSEGKNVNCNDSERNKIHHNEVKKMFIHKLPPKKGFVRQGTALSRIWRQKKRKYAPGRKPRLDIESENMHIAASASIKDKKPEVTTEKMIENMNEKELEMSSKNNNENQSIIKSPEDGPVIVDIQKVTPEKCLEKSDDTDQPLIKEIMKQIEVNKNQIPDNHQENNSIISKTEVIEISPQSLPKANSLVSNNKPPNDRQMKPVPPRQQRRPIYMPPPEGEETPHKSEHTIVLEESQLRLPQKKRHMLNLARTRQFVKEEDEEEEEEPRTTVEINDAGNTVIVVHSNPKAETGEDDWAMGAKEIILTPGQEDEGLMSLANAAQHEEHMQLMKADCDDDGIVHDTKLIKHLMKIATGEPEQIHREGKRAYKREFKVQCRFCTVKVKDYGYLFRHVKKLHPEHPSKKVYLEEIRPLMRTPCPICGKLVSSISNISSHMKQCHATKDAAVNCPLCHKVYKTPVSLRQHLRQCHQPQQKRFYCTQCSASFTENRSLKEHINCTHETTQVFRCENCGKAFLTKGRLRRHKYIHGDFRHRCNYCGKGFHLKDNMNKHIEIVHEKHRGKRFQCNHCGKRFTVKGNMMQHVMGVHLKQFQYNCTVCKHGFRRKKDLLMHMDIHIQNREVTSDNDHEELGDSNTLVSNDHSSEGFSAQEQLEALANGESRDIHIPPEMLKNGDDEEAY